MLMVVLWTGIATAQEFPPRPGGQKPPPGAYEDCRGKKVGDMVLHSTPGGKVDAVCEDSPDGLVARPKRTQKAPRSPDRSLKTPTGPERSSRKNASEYSIEQAVSDQAQLHTIAFNGLAFLTGDFGCATFLPPGKTSDFFGFQYLRDIDSGGKGHNPLFLDRIVGNVLGILTGEQRAMFRDAAEAQQALMQEIAGERFPLIAAFYKELAGNSDGLDRKAVMARCALNSLVYVPLPLA